MFAPRYFAPRYFAVTYWPVGGAAAAPPSAEGLQWRLDGMRIHWRGLAARLHWVIGRDW